MTMTRRAPKRRNRRRFPRVATRLLGTIEGPRATLGERRRSEAFDCTIVSLSPSGVRLVVDTGAAWPFEDGALAYLSFQLDGDAVLLPVSTVWTEPTDTGFLAGAELRLELSASTDRHRHIDYIRAALGIPMPTRHR